MASKHDAARARENFWVMQQNMAKQKGGGGWKPKPRQAPVKTLAPKAATPASPDATPTPSSST